MSKKISLTDDEAYVLHTNMFLLKERGEAKVSNDPFDKHIFKGKTERDIVSNILRKLNRG
jgi:hypothetical protein